MSCLSDSCSSDKRETVGHALCCHLIRSKHEVPALCNMFIIFHVLAFVAALTRSCPDSQPSRKVIFILDIILGTISISTFKIMAVNWH
jgi:hypothetical protein